MCTHACVHVCSVPGSLHKLATDEKEHCNFGFVFNLILLLCRAAVIIKATVYGPECTRECIALCRKTSVCSVSLLEHVMIGIFCFR